MKADLIERVLAVAEHINNTHDTIRKTAQIFGCSKSTIHNDVSIKLKSIDYKLFMEIKQVLDENFAEKHLRGGEATKRKYLEEEESKIIC